VRDTRIPLSTGHPSVPEWIGGKLRLVVLNQMDKVSEAERSRWASYFTRAANTRVVFTNARTGEGVPRLTKLALSGAARARGWHGAARRRASSAPPPLADAAAARGAPQ
jgi:ribosome biogenesis GTPase A